MAEPRLYAAAHDPTLELSQNPIHQRAQEHHHTHDSIRIEERGIETRQITRFHELMLPDQDRRAHSDADIVPETEVRPPSEGDESHDREPMQRLGEEDAAALSPAYHGRMQPGGAVEGFVLKRVKDVEARDPEHHGGREGEQEPARVAPPPRDGEPNA